MRFPTARHGALMAVASMTCVQLGLGVAVGVADEVGAEGAAWLRLVWAGLIVLVLVRPRPSQFTRRTFLASAALGVVTGGVTMLFMVAVTRIPLGTASALEFLGPLTVAVLRSGGRRALAWPVLAGAGVLLLTRPWEGEVDALGVASAHAAAVCWGLYILLTQAVGDEVGGLSGLAVSLPVAGLLATVLVGPHVVPQMTPLLLLWGIGLALLLPLIPFSLEMLALRRLTTSAFGTLMSLEPAIAVAIGLVLLGQVPGVFAVLGVVLVVAAGIGAERTGARLPEPEIHPQGWIPASGERGQ